MIRYQYLQIWVKDIVGYNTYPHLLDIKNPTEFLFDRSNDSKCVYDRWDAHHYRYVQPGYASRSFRW